MTRLYGEIHRKAVKVVLKGKVAFCVLVWKGKKMFDKKRFWMPPPDIYRSGSIEGFER